MQKLIRVILGILIGLLSGLFLLRILNIINTMLSGSVSVMSVFGLFEQAVEDPEWGNRVFAWALLYGLFVVPVIRGIKEGCSRRFQLLKFLICPVFVGAIAVFLMFLVAFVMVLLIRIIEAFLGTDTIIGLAAIVALFIAFCSPVTKYILVIFD